MPLLKRIGKYFKPKPKPPAAPIIVKPNSIQQAEHLLEDFSPDALELVASKLLEKAKEKRAKKLPAGFTPPPKQGKTIQYGGRSVNHWMMKA